LTQIASTRILKEKKKSSIKENNEDFEEEWFNDGV
jgi:hypothetical protein